MIKDIYRDYLFTHNIMIGSENDNAFEALFSLSKLFNIKVKSGMQYANLECVKSAERNIGTYVTGTFYKGFPESVCKLTPDELLLDQLAHYYKTYVCGNFDGEGDSSIFEEHFDRAVLNEETEIKVFSIIREEDVYIQLASYLRDALLSTRPLSVDTYDCVKEFIKDYGFIFSEINCKNTIIKLIIDFPTIDFTQFINLSDILKVLEEVLYRNSGYLFHGNVNIKKLNLTNKQRKLFTDLIDNRLKHYTHLNEYTNCIERRRIWKGLLHHIHYKPITKDASLFVGFIYGNTRSYLSTFEQLMSRNKIPLAATFLQSAKGNGVFLRNLSYILSRCQTETDVTRVVELIPSSNPVILIQLILNYALYAENSPRTFAFSKFNMLKVHKESQQEAARHVCIPIDIRSHVCKILKEKLKNIYKNKLRNVYIEEEMSKVALPLQLGNSNSGYGALSAGTRLSIPKGDTFRAFIYWEKVSDIDLSAIGFNNDGSKEEFSWRSMYNMQSEGVKYSGDETNGYEGGSEFFDIKVEKFKKLHPNVRYLVFCANVFTQVPFSKCICKAGYMTRTNANAGEIFEPKTVKSSFAIKSNSTFAYLFAIDLMQNEVVWLDVNRNSSEIIAGESTDMDFLTRYFNVTGIINVKSLFEMLATKIVHDPTKADVIVGDKLCLTMENKGQSFIHSYDTELLMKYVEAKI